LHEFKASFKQEQQPKAPHLQGSRAAWPPRPMTT